MSITITIVALNPVPDQPIQSVDFYIYDTVSTKLWLWSIPGVPKSASLAAIQAQLDANATAFLADAQNNIPIATGVTAIQRQWIAAHLTWQRVILNTLFTLDNGMLTIPDATLASYRTVLTNTLNAASTLPTAFLTQFTNERTAQGLTMAVSTMTAAQCAAFENLVRSWLLARISMALIADSVKKWLLNGE